MRFTPKMIERLVFDVIVFSGFFSVFLLYLHPLIGETKAVAAVVPFSLFSSTIQMRAE